MNLRTVFNYGIGPIATSAVGLITLPIITWFYSAEDIGRISMLQVVISFSILVFCLGLDQAYVREYHEHKCRPSLLKTTLFPGFLFSSIFFGSIFIFDKNIISNWLYDIPSSYLSIVSIICFLLSLVSRFLSLILRMEERALAYSMSQILPKILFLAFILVTIGLGLRADTYNLITAHTLSIIAVFIVFGWNTKQEWMSSLRCNIDLKELRYLLNFGLPLVIGGLASWGLNVVDRLFLRSMSTFSELGIYSVATTIAGVVAIFSGIFNTIWSPLVYKWVSKGVDISKINEVSEYVLSAVYFVTVFSGLFSWILPYLLPKEYKVIQYLITACILGPLFYTLSEVSSIGITISRKTSFAMIASIGAMLINVFGNFILIPKYGSVGAAISTVVAFYIFYILRTEFSGIVWQKKSNIRSYLIITLLLICVIIHMLCTLTILLSTLLFSLLLLLGCIIFRNSISLAINQIKVGIARL